MLLLLIIDVPLLTQCDDAMKKFINKNLTILWTERRSCRDSIMSKFKPILTLNGTINGVKSIKELRKRIKHTDWLKLPTVFIDEHDESLINSQFDLSINLNNFKLGETSNDYYDFDRLMSVIEQFRIEWYKIGEHKTSNIRDVEAKWNNI